MSNNQTQYNLGRVFKRLSQDMDKQPFDKLLLSLLYSSKILDNYMNQYHDSSRKKQNYLLFQTLYYRLEDIMMGATANQYYIQKQNKKAILNDITLILNKYRVLKNDQFSISINLHNNIQYISIDDVHFYLNLGRRRYEEWSIDQAYRSVQNIMPIIDSKQHIKKQITQELMAQINNIEKDYNQMSHFYSFLKDNKDWQLEMEQKQSKLYYKVFEEEEDSQSTLAIRIQGKIQVDAKSVLCMLVEPQYFTNFIPFIKNSQNLHNRCSNLPSNARVCKCNTQIPYFLQNGETSFYLAIYDRLQTQNSFLIIAQSLKDNTSVQQKYKIQQNYQNENINLKYFCIEIKPINQSSVQMTLVMNPHFDKMKYFDFQGLKGAARTFHSHLIPNITKIGSKLQGSKWETCMRQNSKHYELIQRKINTFFKKSN